MKIIRWLLSHSFLILLIVVVIYGYMFWGNLLGKDTPAGKAVAYLSDEFVVIGEFVDAVKVKQARLNGNQTTVESTEQHPPVIATPNTNVSQVAEQPIEEAAITEVDAEVSNDDAGLQRAGLQTEQQVVDVISAAEVETANRSEGVGGFGQSQETTLASAHTGNAVAIADAQSVSEVVAATATEDVAYRGEVQREIKQDSAEQAFVTPEIEKQLENVDKQGRVIDETKVENTVKVDWITARKSFYQRNYELSEQSYQKVIEKTEDNFDAYGELGNVYFNQGKNEQAASAYYEAAAILVRKGEVSRARSLIGLLRHLDRSKATALQQLIDSAQS